MSGLSITANVACLTIAMLTQGYGQSPQRSLTHGISQTQTALAQVNRLLDDNQSELLSLTATVELQLAGYTPLGHAIDVYNVTANGYTAAKAYQNKDYWAATQELGEAIATIFGENPSLNLGAKAIDAAADLLQLNALLKEQQQLSLVQSALLQQLYRLEGKDPETIAAWQKILNNLYGDPAIEHQAFLNWLAAHNLTQKEVMGQALRNAANPNRVATGLSIVDPSQLPQDLAGIPNINPDFVAALQCDRDGILNIINGGDGMVGVGCARCRRGDPCDRYPDGSYINAFGPPAYDPSHPPLTQSRKTAGLFKSQTLAAVSPKSTDNDSVSVTVSASPPSEFQFLGKAFSVKYYPMGYSTSASVIEIHMKGIGETGMFALFGPEGNVLYSGKWIADPGSDNGTISVPETDYPPGIYYLRAYRGILCCKEYSVGPKRGKKIMSKSSPPYNEVGDLSQLPSFTPTESCSFTIKKGFRTYVTSH